MLHATLRGGYQLIAFDQTAFELGQASLTTELRRRHGVGDPHLLRLRTGIGNCAGVEPWLFDGYRVAASQSNAPCRKSAILPIGGLGLDIDQAAWNT